ALEATGDPNYLFNIGRVHEEAGELELAVSFYERFLDQPGVALEARAATLDRVKVLRAVIEERSRGDGTAAVSPEDTTAPTSDDLEPRSTGVDDIYEQRRRKRLMIAGSVLTGIGGAAIIAGAVMGGL